MSVNSSTLDWAALFDGYRRVVYTNNPLTSVVLQVRFPTLLRLQNEPPMAFQDKILAEYPHYELREVLEVRPPLGGGPPTIQELKVHTFLSSDKNWKISLGADYVSLSTSKYERWEDFKKKTSFCMDAFFGLYPIKVITRIGLRYRNLIRPNALKMNQEKIDWSSFINPVILGPMGERAFSAVRFESARWEQRFAFSDVRITFQGGLRTERDEKCYVLDCDASFSKEIIVERNLLQAELERLHQPVGPLFRWAITDELHKNLGPRPD